MPAPPLVVMSVVVIVLLVAGWFLLLPEDYVSLSSCGHAEMYRVQREFPSFRSGLVSDTVSSWPATLNWQRPVAPIEDAWSNHFRRPGSLVGELLEHQMLSRRHAALHR